MSSRVIALRLLRPEGAAVVDALAQALERRGEASIVLRLASEAPVDPRLSTLEQMAELPPELLRNYLLSPDGMARIAVPPSQWARVFPLVRRSYAWCWLVMERLDDVLIEASDFMLWTGPRDAFEGVPKEIDDLKRRHYPLAFSQCLVMDSETPRSVVPGVETMAALPAKEAESLRFDAACASVAERLLTDPTLYVWRAQTSSVSEASVQRLQEKIQPRLLEALTKAPGSDVTALAHQTLESCLAEETEIAPDRASRSRVFTRMVEDVLGLGPLEALLKDPEISEVMVNGPATIFVERRGRLEASPVQFKDDEQLRGVIDRIVTRIGRRVDEASPLCDARLPDGSRVNIVLPPLALDGATMTIRKFSRHALSLADLVQGGSLSPVMQEFLSRAVLARKNIIVSGGTGSGKTTLLNALSGLIPDHERIVTIEDAAELRLQKPHVVRMESRPPNIEGQGAIPIRRLVMNALRMRPDRIVVGECRGGEALDMLQAMNTGHDGSLTTLHANAPREALHRLETLVLMGDVELPLRVVREQICGAVDVIVQQARFADGRRLITSIAEVTGMEADTITLQELFRYRQGHFEVCGTPACFEEAAC